MAFTDNNCNTMFAGLRRNEQERNVFATLKLKVSLTGVGCPPLILNNCIHHENERISIDVENIINEIHQYFSTFTLPTEQSKCNTNMNLHMSNTVQSFFMARLSGSAYFRESKH